MLYDIELYNKKQHEMKYLTGITIQEYVAYKNNTNYTVVLVRYY